MASRVGPDEPVLTAALRDGDRILTLMLGSGILSLGIDRPLVCTRALADVRNAREARYSLRVVLELVLGIGK